MFPVDDKHEHLVAGTVVSGIASKVATPLYIYIYIYIYVYIRMTPMKLLMTLFTNSNGPYRRASPWGLVQLDDHTRALPAGMRPRQVYQLGQKKSAIQSVGRLQ